MSDHTETSNDNRFNYTHNSITHSSMDTLYSGEKKQNKNTQFKIDIKKWTPSPFTIINPARIDEGFLNTRARPLVYYDIIRFTLYTHFYKK